MDTQTINISLPRELVKKADKAAKKEFTNRSNLIRTALRSYIDKKSAWDEIRKYGEKQRVKLGISSEEEVDQIVYNYRHFKK